MPGLTKTSRPGEPGFSQDLEKPNVRYLLFAGIVVLAAVLRLALLARDGLWADECQTIFLARIPLSDLVAMVRDQVGPIASFKHVVVVKQLPKTRSGKILRRTMRRLAQGESVQVPSTIEDPRVLEDLSDTIRRLHSLGGKAEP